jgi:hypothetical protein
VPAPLARVAPITAPAAASYRGAPGRGAAPGVGAPAARARTDVACRLAVLAETRPVAAPAGGAAGHGASYGGAVYRAVDALRAPAGGEAVEVSVRQAPDGGRLTVARRTAGARTVAIEAQVA